MTKEEVLANHAADELYHDGLVFDGSTDPIMDAMDEYAKQQAIAFAKWVMNNCVQDLGDSDDNRWAYFPQGDSSCISDENKTDDELYTLYLNQL